MAPYYYGPITKMRHPFVCNGDINSTIAWSLVIALAVLTGYFITSKLPNECAGCSAGDRLAGPVLGTVFIGGLLCFLYIFIFTQILNLIDFLTKTIYLRRMVMTSADDLIAKRRLYFKLKFNSYDDYSWSNITVAGGELDIAEIKQKLESIRSMSLETIWLGRGELHLSDGSCSVTIRDGGSHIVINSGSKRVVKISRYIFCYDQFVSIDVKNMATLDTAIELVGEELEDRKYAKKLEKIDWEADKAEKAEVESARNEAIKKIKDEEEAEIARSNEAEKAASEAVLNFYVSGPEELQDK